MSSLMTPFRPSLWKLVPDSPQRCQNPTEQNRMKDHLDTTRRTRQDGTDVLHVFAEESSTSSTELMSNKQVSPVSVHGSEEHSPAQTEASLLGDGLRQRRRGGGAGGGRGDCNRRHRQSRRLHRRLTGQKLFEHGVHLAADHLLVDCSLVWLNKAWSVCRSESPLSQRVQGVSPFLGHWEMPCSWRSGLLPVWADLVSSLSPRQRCTVTVHAHPCCVLHRILYR